MDRFIVLILILVFVMSFSLSASAMVFTSSYGDMTSSSSQATNLINFAMGYDSFITSDWVCFRSGQNDYYLVWGDELEVNNRTVSGSDVEYVRYFRASNQAEWSYIYDSDTTFALTSDYVCSSNLKNYGFSNPTYSEYLFEYRVKGLLIIVTGLVFAYVVYNFVFKRG